MQVLADQVQTQAWKSACTFSVLSVFATGSAWESMLENRTHAAEPSRPRCLSWDHPRPVDSHIPTGYSQVPDGWKSAAIRRHFQPNPALVTDPQSHKLNICLLLSATAFSDCRTAWLWPRNTDASHTSWEPGSCPSIWFPFNKKIECLLFAKHGAKGFTGLFHLILTTILSRR